MWERHLFFWVYTDTTSATCPSQTGSLATTPITLATVMCDANEPCSVNTAYARVIFDNVTSEYDSTFTLLKLCFQLRILEMTDVRQCSKVDIICLSLSSQNTLNFALYFSDCELLAFLVHSESKYTSLCSCGSAVLRTAHVCCSVSRHKQRSDDHADFHDVHTSKWLGSKAWATHPCSVLYELKKHIHSSLSQGLDDSEERKKQDWKQLNTVRATHDPYDLSCTAPLQKTLWHHVNKKFPGSPNSIRDIALVEHKM